MVYRPSESVIEHRLTRVFPDERLRELADGLERHPQTVRDRLQWLREWGYVQYYHESTGLHELVLTDERK